MLDKIEVVINHIDDNFNSEIRRKDIEELADCSFENFSVEFEKETGMQFLRYLVRRQLSAATFDGGYMASGGDVATE